MWILGLVALFLIVGFWDFIKIIIGWFIIAYILYLLAIFCPALVGVLVIGGFIYCKIK